MKKTGPSFWFALPTMGRRDMGLRLLLLKHTRWLALVGACGAIACSSNKSPTPDAYVMATVQGSGGTCNVTAATPIVSVGTTLVNTKPATITSGQSEMGGANISITCNIVPSGMGFDIQLSVVQAGQGGGSLTITSGVRRPSSPCTDSLISK